MGLQILCAGETTEESEEEEEEEEEEESSAGKVGLFSMEPALPWYRPNGFSLPDLVMASFTSTYLPSLRDSLQKHLSDLIFILTDPRIRDNPIIYASHGFLEMTQYSSEEVLGRNCLFMQGPLTSRRAVMEISEGFKEERGSQVACVLYSKKGKAFRSFMDIAPLFSREDGRVVHFVGVFIPFPVQTTRIFGDGLCRGARRFCSLYADIKLHADKEGLSPPLQDEDECEEVSQADKDKARLSVNLLVEEITRKCKGVGVSGTRCLMVPATMDGVISSSLMLSLTKIQQSFVLVNPNLPNWPIVHASNHFLCLSGYTREEVIGCNCRFMQGPDTDPRAVLLIREALQSEKSCTVTLLNYRKGGSTFWNSLHISPVRSNTGKIAFFVGVQLDVTSSVDGRIGEVGSVPYIQHLGVVGAVKVAVRGLHADGLRRRMHKSE